MGSEGQGDSLSRSDARKIIQSLDNGWTTQLKDKWADGAAGLLASDNERNKATGMDLIRSMRAVDVKQREVELKERELALKERLADNAERRKLTRELAAGNPSALIAAIAKHVHAADGRTGQPIGIDGSQASQSAGHQDPGTNGLESKTGNA